MSRASTLFYPQAPKKSKSNIRAIEASDVDTISLDESAGSHQTMATSTIDFARLDHVAHKAYRHCHNAGEDYAEVAHEVHKLHNVLRTLRDSQEHLESTVFRKDPESAHELYKASSMVRQTLEELDIVLEKFEDRKRDKDKDQDDDSVMSAARKKLWSRIKNGSKKEELSMIKFKLVSYTSTIRGILGTMQIVPTLRSRPHSKVRKPQRRDSNTSTRSETIAIGGSSTRSTPRGSGANTPLSTSPTDQIPPAAIPNRLLEERKSSRRGSDAGALSESSRSSSKSRRSSREEAHRRRRRSSSVLSLENPPKADMVDISSSKKDNKSSKSTLSTVSHASDLGLAHSKSYSPRNSKVSSPNDPQDMQFSAADGKAIASKSVSEPASPMIDALNLDYFRRASAPGRNSARASAKRDSATRGYRMSWQLDDVKEVAEKPTTPPATSKLSAASISDVAVALKPNEMRVKSPSNPGSRAVSPTTVPSETSDVPPTKVTESTDKPPPPKAKTKPAKPTLMRTMSGRPFTDPWKALTMDTKQLKALRADANQKSDVKKIHEVSRSNSRSDITKPKLIKEASSKSDSKSDIGRISPPESGAIVLGKPNKYRADAKARRKRRSKYSWYKTLNYVKLIRSLRAELAPANNGHQLKSILKGPANLKKDPGAPARESSVPLSARFTKIRRSIVCPEALELGHEKFEIEGDNVIVLRVLSRVEIDGYASRTKDIREQRRNHPSDQESDAEMHPDSSKMVNEVVNGLANLAASFLQNKKHAAQ